MMRERLGPLLLILPGILLLTISLAATIPLPKPLWLKP